MKSIASKTTHLGFIDGLRGLAILGVMANHWYLYALSPWLTKFRWMDLSAGIVSGSLGVQLFFIVSAFTLFNSSQARLKEDASPYLNFYIRRAFRILPLWWAALAVSAHIKGTPVWQHPCCLFLYFPWDKNYHLIPAGWSLVVEESFYLLLPLVMPFTRRAWHAVVLLGFTVAIRMLWLSPAGKALPEFMPALHWYCFGLGIGLYFLLRQERLHALLQNKRTALFLDAGALLAVGIAVPTSSWDRHPELSAVSLAALFLVASSRETLVGRLCRQTWLAQFGVCCYSLYLGHALFIDRFSDAIRRITASTGLNAWPMEILFPLSFAAFAFSLLGVAYFSFTYFEVPGIRLGKRLISRLELRSARKRSSPSATLPTRKAG